MKKSDWLPEDRLAKLDPILKKIRATGIKSLDESEIKTLDAASAYLRGLKK